ncbi:DNA polymerase family B-domain-containing protein [Syncephalastrum racemosum]|uniref:DNA polymerase n=1 Tax=Syncephalastrum racemosum TaxID=13706 RepID=A0A1X2HAL7_SYNRA|nr:DNA polymerase family B-domain-containing protein [Syncephalastrum racemosum]
MMEIDSKTVWARKEAPPLNPAKDKLVFQQIEADDYIDRAMNKPTVRLFGVTENGNTVLCHVHSFLPYFYFPAPAGLKETHLPILKSALSGHLTATGGARTGDAVYQVELVNKQSLYGYNGDEKQRFVKVTLYDPRDIAKAARAVCEGEIGSGTLPVTIKASTVFESNLAYLLRFMIDNKVTGCNWIELPAGTYKAVQRNVSYAQYEVEIHYENMISHPPDGEWSKMAPLRILSFDIECAGRKGIFPEANIDPVIQIASVVKIHSEKHPFVKNVFTLGETAPIAGTDIHAFEEERDMLQAWRDFFIEADPDVVIGYNICNFDFPYLLDRAKFLRVDNFPFFSRIRGLKTEAKDTRFSSKAFGTRENKAVNLDGRLQLDLLQAIQRDYKLRSYSLNSVSHHFLGEQKEDVHYSIITELHQGNPETRRRLASYCLKDAFLPIRLLERLMMLFNYTEMARVTGVPFNYILVRGQQVKVVSQLYRKAMEKDIIVPVVKSDMTDEQYEGATVIEPVRGYYDQPITTLDFTSLYPSIMQAHNLCYTTLVTKDTIQRLGLREGRDADYIETPNRDYFVTSNRRKGILPEILTDLLAARKAAKADLKKETDPSRRAVLDGRQLALKISANSVYGFTGATIGKLPCLQISSSVTAYGREMILKTREIIESHFTMKNNYEHDAQVIYGDTDSVMIKFGVDNLERAMELGREGASLVTSHFIRPINLDFEKVYFPYLLISKKRYAGLFWSRPDKYDKLDAKGIETVRRDNCRLVSSVIQTSLNKLLIDRDVAGAQEFVKQTIADLLQNKVDMSNLVITKALSKSDYAVKQAHVELAKRMQKRDAGSAPSLGDRVAYIITKASGNTPAYERAEDPLYALDNNIPIDPRYYLDNQLSKPLQRIFEPILGDKVSELLQGAHTQAVKVVTPSVGGLMRFAVKTLQCLGCKAPLPKGDNSPLCKHCLPRMAELAQYQAQTADEATTRFARLWTQCQRCQESLHQDVICSNNDCTIFFMRKKAQKDAEEANARLERFDAFDSGW